MNKENLLNNLIKDLDRQLPIFAPEIPAGLKINIYMDQDHISFHITGSELDEYCNSLESAYEIAKEYEDYLNSNQ